MLEVKNTLTEIKNAFDGLINRWDMVKERISVLKDMTVNISKTEKQRKQTKKKPRLFKICETTTKEAKTHNRKIRRRKEQKRCLKHAVRLNVYDLYKFVC